MAAPPVDEFRPAELTRVRRAILVVDVVESVRLMQAFEADVIDRWRRFLNDALHTLLPPHGGRLVKSLGDGMLVEFSDARAAAAACFCLHRRMRDYNQGRPPEAEMRLRAGLHVADIVIDELDIYGPGVNLAARVASLAAPGETVITAQARDELLDGVDAELEDLGDLFVKHLDQAVHCFRISPARLRGAEAASPSLHPAVAPAQTNAVIPRLAVMPLVGHGLQGADVSAGRLVADNLSHRLSRSTMLRLISQLSAAALMERGLTVTEIARQLGATYVVAGTIVALSATRWRLSVELADGDDGAVWWSRTDDLEPASLVAPDDDYSAELACQLLEAVASHQVQRMATHSLPSLQSYSLQLAGLQLMHRAARVDFDRARSVLETLVDRHPRSPTPRAWLSQWWVLRTTRGIATAPQEEAVQALSHTRSALQSDPQNALALAAQGFIECHMSRDLDAAEDTLERAIECNPNEPLAWLYRSVVNGFRGQGEAAYRAAQTALSLSPLDPQRHYFDALCGAAAIVAGQHARGIELAQRALLVNRKHLPTLRALALGQVESGDLAGARSTVARLMQLDPRFTIHGYIGSAPRGAEEARLRFAQALATAGVPLG